MLPSIILCAFITFKNYVSLFSTKAKQQIQSPGKGVRGVIEKKREKFGHKMSNKTLTRQEILLKLYTYEDLLHTNQFWVDWVL